MQARASWGASGDLQSCYSGPREKVHRLFNEVAVWDTKHEIYKTIINCPLPISYKLMDISSSSERFLKTTPV